MLLSSKGVKQSFSLATKWFRREFYCAFCFPVLRVWYLPLKYLLQSIRTKSVLKTVSCYFRLLWSLFLDLVLVYVCKTFPRFKQVYYVEINLAYVSSQRSLLPRLYHFMNVPWTYPEPKKLHRPVDQNRSITVFIGFDGRTITESYAVYKRLMRGGQWIILIHWQCLICL